MAGHGEQKLFQNNPSLYRPAFYGHDVVIAKDIGEVTRGKREHGFFFGDQIYMFASEDSLEQFSKTPFRYVISPEDDVAADGIVDTSIELER